MWPDRAKGLLTGKASKSVFNDVTESQNYVTYFKVSATLKFKNFESSQNNFKMDSVDKIFQVHTSKTREWRSPSYTFYGEIDKALSISQTRSQYIIAKWHFQYKELS